MSGLFLAAVDEEALHPAQEVARAVNAAFPDVRAQACLRQAPQGSIALPALMYHHTEPSRIGGAGGADAIRAAGCCVMLNVSPGFPFIGALRNRASALLGATRIIETPDLSAGGALAPAAAKQLMEYWQASGGGGGTVNSNSEQITEGAAGAAAVAGNAAPPAEVAPNADAPAPAPTPKSPYRIAAPAAPPPAPAAPQPAAAPALKTPQLATGAAATDAPDEDAPVPAPTPKSPYRIAAPAAPPPVPTSPTASAAPALKTPPLGASTPAEAAPDTDAPTPAPTPKSPYHTAAASSAPQPIPAPAAPDTAPSSLRLVTSAAPPATAPAPPLAAAPLPALKTPPPAAATATASTAPPPLAPAAAAATPPPAPSVATKPATTPAPSPATEPTPTSPPEPEPSPPAQENDSDFSTPLLEDEDDFLPPVIYGLEPPPLDWTSRMHPIYRGAPLPEESDSHNDFFILQSLIDGKPPAPKTARAAAVAKGVAAAAKHATRAAVSKVSALRERDATEEDGAPGPHSRVDLQLVAELMEYPLPDMYHKWREQLPSPDLAPQLDNPDYDAFERQISTLLATAEGEAEQRAVVMRRVGGVCLLLQAHALRARHESGEEFLRRMISAIDSEDDLFAPLRKLALLLLVENAPAAATQTYNTLVDFLDAFQADGTAQRHPMLMGVLLRLLIIALDARGKQQDKDACIGELEKLTQRLSPDEIEAIGAHLFVKMRKLRATMGDVL